MIRSMLFVPADSERKIAKIASLDADAIVIDLEDSVLPDRKPLAREMMVEYLADTPIRERIWVRVNDMTSGEILKDLAVVVPARPQGIILPKILGPEDVDAVCHYLDALEAANNIAAGSTKMCVIVTETPAATLRLGELVTRSYPRITGLMWGAEDLSSAIGAGDPRADNGAWRSTYEYARTQAILASHAMGVEAIDTVYVDFKDPEGFDIACRESRYDGFTGRVAIHPNQIAIINEAFTASDDELAMAQRIIDAFQSGAGAVSIDGKMYDIPHLKAAKRLLGQV